MSLDARELVAGLLDRWERTLEQRIYTEQRQRFQAELVARQTMVKQLQMELHTARAEHAAAQAEKDRVLAGKERELADRERDLAESRRIAQAAAQAVAPPASRRRRWFWARDD
jgi:peptidoglycan hydrolase CwlO-like protein